MIEFRDQVLACEMDLERGFLALTQSGAHAGWSDAVVAQALVNLAVAHQDARVESVSADNPTPTPELTDARPKLSQVFYLGRKDEAG